MLRGSPHRIDRPADLPGDGISTLTASREANGFTLIEMLLVIVLVGVLAAALIPAVLSRLQVGEQAAIMTDVDALRSALMAYRGDVGSYPNDLRLLAVAPTATSRDLCNQPLSVAAINSWRGPYLNREIPAGGLPSGSSSIRVAVRRFPLGSSNTGDLLIDVDRVDGQVAAEIERAIDGNSDLSGGTVRWVAVGGVLTVAMPVRGC